MTKILVLGAGVMGSALCVPAAAGNHTANTNQTGANQVTLVGSPLDDSIIDSINATRYHPTLDAEIPATITAIKNNQCSNTMLQDQNVIIIGVSSAGIDWATDRIRNANAAPLLVSLITKGLISNPQENQPPLTYAHTLPDALNIDAGKVVGIGGPCIARELALGVPTRVIFGSTNINACNTLRDYFQTDTYRIKTTSEIVQLEACAALKNFLCIGVSTMIVSHKLGETFAKNPVAALFNQAVIELRLLSEWIACSDTSTPAAQQLDPVAFDLAGMGDLHVTVGGGRNSRLGQYLGQGHTLSAILENQMQGVTVEGVDTGRQILSGVHSACESGKLEAEALPLTTAILKSISTGGAFEFDFTQLPG